MTTATVPPEVEAYLGSVRNALHDLPTAERDDLLAEVEASLVDASAEGGSLTARLGPPEAFAEELRSAAGLHDAAAPAERRPSRLARRLAALAAHPRALEGRRLASELAPIWWVARAYLAVGLGAVLLGADWSTRLPIVPRLRDSVTSTLVLIVVATAVSVALGLRARRHPTRWPRVVGALNAALVLAAVPIVDAASEAASFQGMVLTTPMVADAPPPAGVVNNGVPVDNIYPYSRSGKLLHDVLLYDGAGRPLEIPTDTTQNPDQRVVVTNGNKPLFNVFPIRYYEPGTKRVARPNAAPYVELPLVLTPALPARDTP